MAAWHILLIDDDEEDFLLIRNLLTQLSEPPINLEWASSYTAGQRALRAGAYDAILLDYDLGALNGLQFLQAARAGEMELPVIFVSGREHSPLYAAVLEAGAADFIPKKDLSAALLERSIRYALERRRLEQQLQAAQQPRQPKAGSRPAERGPRPARPRSAAPPAEQPQSEILVRLVQDSPAGIALLHGPDHRYTLVNAAYARIGRGKEPFVGRTVTEVWPEIAAEVVPQLDAVYHNQKSFHIQDNPLTIQRGDELEQNYFSYTFTPIKDSAGDIYGVAILVTETTEQVRVRQQLEAERNWLNAVLQQLPVGVAITTAAGAEMIVNRRYRQLIGLPLDAEFERNSLLRLPAFFPNGQPVSESDWPVIQAIETGQRIENWEIEVVLPTGEHRNLVAAAAPIVSAAGETTHGVVVIDDITERKALENELAYQALLLENIHDSIVATDDRLIVTAWNRAAEALYGYPPEEVIGRLIHEVIVSEFTPEQRAHALNQMMQGRGYLLEVAQYTRDGRRIFTEGRTIPLLDAKGVATGYVSTARDITARKHAESRLRESEERFRTLANSAPVMIWMADADGGRIFFNQFWLDFTGRSMAQEMGNGWSAGVHPDDREYCLASYRDHLAQRTAFEMEYRLARHDGDYRWLLDRGAPRFDPDGEFTGYIGSCIDITVRKQAEIELSRNYIHLQETEKQIRSVLNSLFAFVGVLTPDGVLIEANNPPLLAAGLKRADVFGRRFEETYWWNYAPEVRAKIRAAIQKGAAGQASRFDIQARMQNDRLMTLDFMLAPLLDDHGQVRFLIPSAVDVTERKNIEQALRRSEERFRLSLQNTPVSVHTLDADLHYTWSYNNLFGKFSPTEIQNRCNQDFLPNDIAAELSAFMGEILAAGACARREFSFTLDGAWRSFDISVEAILDPQGSPAGLTIAVLDLTTLRHLEKDNERQRSALQTIFEAEPNGLAVISLEAGGWVLQQTNPAFMRLARQETPFQKNLSLLEFWLPGLSPSDRQKLTAALEDGQPHSFDRLEYQASGEPARTFSLQVRPLAWFERQGALLALWETTRLEEALAEAHHRAAEAEAGQQILNALLEYIPEGIALADAPDARLHLISHYGSAMIGVSPEQLIGQTSEHQPAQWFLTSVDAAGPVDPANLPLSRAVTGGEVIRNEEWLMHPINRDPVYISCSAGPIRDRSGVITGGVLAWQDITARKQLEETAAAYMQELERSNRELQEFAFIASHDLQEPLRKVRAFSDILRREYAAALDEKGLDYITRMQTAAARMQRMIADLLDYSRITTHGSQFEAISLNGVVQEVIGDLQWRLDPAHGRIDLDPLPDIEADRRQMVQLFQNLIGNALKYHRPGEPPRVRVGVRGQDSRQVTLFVADNGIGFDMQYLERIFQPFQRLHGKSEYEGNGIGLAICRKIIERHGGAITAESAPGVGTTFLVTLPLRQPPPQPLAQGE